MMATDIDARVVDAACARGLVDAARIVRVRAFAAHRGDSLVHALRELRVLADDELLALMEEASGVEAIDPGLVSADPSFTEAVERLWPSPIASATRTIPIRYVGAALQVAMVEPWDSGVRTALEAFTGGPVVPALMLDPGMDVPLGDTATLLADHWRARVSRPLDAVMRSAAERVNRRHAAVVSMEELARAPEVILAVHALLCRAAVDRASDVHIDPVAGQLRIRFRIDGRLRDVLDVPQALTEAVVARLRLLGRARGARDASVFDASFRVAVSPERRLDVRLAIVPALTGERCSLRLVDREAGIPALSDLGMEASTQSLIEAAIAEPHGLVIVTGPTGSGKSSTLYAMLPPIAVAEKAIVTAEDPVEREVPGVVQVPCSAQEGLGFANVLRALLRQDPDVIMVGEIRDAETAQLAVTAAGTGHLVLTSLHANTSASTLTRLIGLGVEPFALATVAKVVVSQRLARHLCASCKVETLVPAATWLRAGGGPVTEPVLTWVPVGCARCFGTGYAGRLGLFETLRVSPAIRALIYDSATASEIERHGRVEGLVTLREAGLARVRQGDTSLAEVLSVTSRDD